MHFYQIFGTAHIINKINWNDSQIFESSQIKYIVSNTSLLFKEFIIIQVDLIIIQGAHNYSENSVIMPG